MPISNIWNPQEYNPLAMQMGMSMLGSQGGPGRGGAIRGAAEKILGAIMSKGQQREYGKDLDSQILSMLTEGKQLVQPGNNPIAGMQPGGNMAPPDAGFGQPMGPNPDPGMMPPAAPGGGRPNGLTAAIMNALGGEQGGPPPGAGPGYGGAGAENTLLPNFSEAPGATEQETIPATGANKVAPVTSNPQEVGQDGTITRSVAGVTMQIPALMGLAPGVEAIARAALKSNDPAAKKQAADLLIKHHAAKNPLTPDKRFMNLGDGRVFDVLKQEHIDAPWKPPEMINVPKNGMVIVPTPDGPVKFTNNHGADTELKQVLDKEYYDRTGIPLYNWHVYDPAKEQWANTGLVAKVNRTRTDTSNADLTTSSRGKFQQDLHESRQSLDRLNNIQSMFDGDNMDFFLTKPGEFAVGAVRFMSDWRVPMPKSWKEKGVEGSEFLTHVSLNSNLYIKEITGAQMSDPEAKRLLKAIPNKDDPPVIFRGKLQAVLDIVKRSVDEYEKVLNEHPDPTSYEADRLAREASGRIASSEVNEDGSLINFDPRQLGIDAGMRGGIEDEVAEGGLKTIEQLQRELSGE